MADADMAEAPSAFARAGDFEWVSGWADLAPLLTPAALGLDSRGVPPRAVDIGCGTSALAVRLAETGSFSSVTGVDREAACVVHMRSRYGEAAGLRWSECDVASDAIDSVLPAGSAELVVDKGTLDCAIVEHDAARLLCNVWQLLAPGGVYVIISFRAPELLLHLLSGPALPWAAAPRHTELTHQLTASGRPASVCVLRKPAAAGLGALDVSCVAAHVAEAVDAWYRQAEPLLTAEREAKLRRDWATALAERALDSLTLAAGAAGAEAPASSLPLRTVYSVLFTDEERGEMEFDEFAADAAPFLAAAGAAPEGATAMSLEQAIGFLEFAQ